MLRTTLKEVGRLKKNIISDFEDLYRFANDNKRNEIKWYKDKAIMLLDEIVDEEIMGAVNESICE